MPEKVALEVVSCAICGSHRQSDARIRAPRDDHARDLGLRDSRSHWVVCDDCGLVYQSPRPDEAGVAELYEGGTYHVGRGGVPEHYVQYSLRRSHGAFAWAFSLPELRTRRGSALDVGCGIGGALVGLRERGFEVRGVEPDPMLSEFGRTEFSLDITTGYFGRTTFPSGTAFDFAYSCHVWEHLADPVEATSAVHEVLADREGYFLIVVPTFRKAKTLAWACFTAPHTYMWTDVSLGNLLERAGFEVIDHRYAAAADSELWMLARAVRSPAPREIAREATRDIQRELALVPLRAPLGLPGRVRTHVQTLASDPRDFLARAQRWAAAQAARAKRAAGLTD